MENGQDSTLQYPKRARNWSLIIGLILVSLIILLAILGPRIAPRDPLEENVILQLNGKWYVPPFSLLTPGFPLGSDDYGRDMYSRVLWAIRPTLIMVTIVAVIRLILGVIIGLMAGWLTGRFSRFLDNLIQTFLAIPVLIVALGAIAVIGVEYGIWAFVLGLSINGWVETAQQVREQTRIVKGQTYIEAAHAIGATSRQTLSRHVLKQILPMLAMLFAFEISSTLMTTAGLGFLGYYIGGDVWVEVSDYVSRRISGMPELGQMLATSWVTITKPWTMLVVGTTIFITVLGFNLIGEGLRRNLDFGVVRRRGIVSKYVAGIEFWLDEHVGYPVATTFQKPAVRYFTYGMLALIGIAFLAPPLMKSQLSIPKVSDLLGGSNQAIETETATASETPQTGVVPGNESTGTTLPTAVAVIEWQIQETSGFDGGPALSPDGKTLYVVSNDGIVTAIQTNSNLNAAAVETEPPSDETHQHAFLGPIFQNSNLSMIKEPINGLLWQARLPAGGKGTLASDASGNIYAADIAGGLSKLSPTGEIVWHFQSEAGGISLSGPVVAPDGNIYYTPGTTAKANVQAVSPDGEGLWATPAETSYIYEPLSASKDGKYLFLKDNIFLIQTGELLKPKTDLKVLEYFSGEDGKNYLVSGHTIIQWELSGQSLQVIDNAEWDSSSYPSIVAPAQTGVSADSTGWMLFSYPSGPTDLIWVTLEDKVLGDASYEFGSAILAAIQPDLTGYVCGRSETQEKESECVSMSPVYPDPIWTLELGSYASVQGGVWDGNRLYITTNEGSLIAISEEQTGSTASADIPPTLASTEVNAAENSGLVWAYPITEATFENSFPRIDQDGTVTFVTEDLVLNKVNPDGQLDYQYQLPAGLMRLRPDEPDYIFPIILPDGSAVVFMDNNSVIGLTPAGELAWEETLASSVEGHPALSDQGVLYAIDKAAGLYAFDSNGLKWKFKSDAAPFSAGGIAFGPEGQIYYTVTTRGKGYVQAVSPEGQGLWVTAADTGYFYNELFASSDGAYVFLREDIFDAATGSLLKPEIPVPVYNFIVGEDGNNYLQTDSAVAQWQLGPDGFEILKNAAWQTTQPRGTLPYVYIDKNSIIYVNFFDSIIRLTTDGEILGKYSPNYSGNRLEYYNFENSTITQCSHDPKTDVLTCSAYPIGSDKPIWETSIPNIDSFNASSSTLEGGYLYILDRDNTLSKYAIEQH